MIPAFPAPAPSACTVVACTRLHAEVLAALHHAAFAGMPDAPWTAESFAALLGGSATGGLLALDGPDQQQPVGFLLWQGAADQAEILTLGVVPEGRRRGVAAALLRALNSQLQVCGFTTLFLEVADDNCAARSFYTQNGFVVAGRRRGYYSPPHPGQSRRDALVLSLEIEEIIKPHE